METAKKVYIRTLGCDKNTVDSQMIAGRMIAGQYQLTEDPEAAVVIIVNTCCFIEDAKRESIDAIFDLLTCKTSGCCETFIVAGCMAQRYAQELQVELPEVDAFLGVNNLDDILKLIEDSGKVEQPAMTDDATLYYRESSVPRALPPSSATAYLKIAEGCDKHCTYCAIPSIRGPYRSRKPEVIIEEAHQLRDQGVQECILIAQDLTEYGKDLPEAISLADLLDRLASEVDFPWIRLLYLYPEGINTELLNTMARHKNICYYLDLPIQHTENAILKRMGRSIDKKGIYDIVNLIRQTLPDVILRTTIITGFPGEREADFEALLQSLKELQFDRLGAFAYSQEENTPAAKLPDQIDDVVKILRRNRIYEQQQEISAKKNAAMVGKVLPVLVETYEDGNGTGRTAGDAPDIDCGVIIEGAANLETGRFYKVKVTASLDYDLIGEVL